MFHFYELYALGAFKTESWTTEIMFHFLVLCLPVEPIFSCENKIKLSYTAVIK